MTEHFPIPSPPPTLWASLRNSAPHGIRDAGVTRELWLVNKAYAAGADQELEACVNYVDNTIGGNKARALRAARRPKPPSLKEQALDDFDGLMSELDEAGQYSSWSERIRQALEQLPN